MRRTHLAKHKLSDRTKHDPRLPGGQLAAEGRLPQAAVRGPEGTVRPGAGREGHARRPGPRDGGALAAPVRPRSGRLAAGRTSGSGGCPARGALSWIAAQPSGDGLGRIWTPNGRLEGVEPMIEPVGRPSTPTMDDKGRTATRTEPKQRRGQT